MTVSDLDPSEKVHIEPVGIPWNSAIPLLSEITVIELAPETPVTVIPEDAVNTLTTVETSGYVKRSNNTPYLIIESAMTI